MVLGRAVLLTVPKSHRSSGSVVAGLETVSFSDFFGKESHIQILKSVLCFLLEAFPSFSFPPFVPLDQLSKVTSFLCHSDELVLEQFASGWALYKMGISSSNTVSTLTSRGSR
jgi:hypothetical protein